MTAIFGKIGVERINADFATLLRVGVILIFSACLVAATGAAQPLASIPTARGYSLSPSVSPPALRGFAIIVR